MNKKIRNSNLELYRIIVMYLIVVHHYVVNSGLLEMLNQAPNETNSYIASLLGMWGKTGINCFMLITGYFMCTSTITLNKLIKLLGEIYFYRIIIFLIFLCIGYEEFTSDSIYRILMPILNLQRNFTSCFIAFYLFIPFLNHLITSINKKMHLRLIILCLTLYTVVDALPMNTVEFSYVTWFIILYFIASYIRLYPIYKNNDIKFWRTATLIAIFISIITVLKPAIFSNRLSWFYVSDSNAPLALIVSICSFMFFKNIDIKYNKWINIVGGSTFGVLLIHANSDAMRQWLWVDTCQNVKWLQSEYFIVHIILSTLIIFIICTIIDRIRILFIEKPLMNKINDKIENLSKKLEKSKI